MNSPAKATMSARLHKGGARNCPICGKPQVEKFKPFCSKRCADIDLSRWLRGTYAVPAGEVPDEYSGEDDVHD